MDLLTPEILALLASAAGIALVHTLMGPDHCLPFVSLAVARACGQDQVMFGTDFPVLRFKRSVDEIDNRGPHRTHNRTRCLTASTDTTTIITTRTAANR